MCTNVITGFKKANNKQKGSSKWKYSYEIVSAQHQVKNGSDLLLTLNIKIQQTKNVSAVYNCDYTFNDNMKTKSITLKDSVCRPQRGFVIFAAAAAVVSAVVAVAAVGYIGYSMVASWFR